MTLTEMRALARRDLKDEDSQNYRWTDDEIDRAVLRAVSELSKHVPREMKDTIATTDGSREIDISSLADRVSMDKVEFPADQHPGSFQRFSVYRDTLTLLGDLEGDGDDCYVYWSKAHTLDGATSTIPFIYESLVALGATAFAVISQSQYHSNFANTGGEHVDRDYAFWGRNRLKQFHGELKRISLSRKLKTGRFYVE